MAVCGHQLQGGDVTDWILSTSASCLDGSTTASQILRELFTRQRTESVKNVKKRQKPADVKPQSNDRKYEQENNETLIVKRIAGKHGFEDFDESQHLNGCPMKWLYNKKLLEKNKRYKVDRICYKKFAKKEEVKREKCKNLRDKTPIEVKIHKINLTEKYATNHDESHVIYQSLFVKKADAENGADLETHRKNLAAKLNWKFHDETPDEPSLPSSELKRNYLPPRPMLGLKPFLSLLLAPNHMTDCCSLTALARNSAKKGKITSSLSIQSLDLPAFPPQNSHSRVANSSRWGSKSWRLAKKLQIPNQITINMEKNQTGGSEQVSESKIAGSNPTFKKMNDKPKQMKSLSALFYELKDKSNFRNRSEKSFEIMIKNLTTEGQFKIRRFLNMGAENFDLHVKIPQQERSKQKVASADEFDFVCEKIRFFKKRALSHKAKSTRNELKM